MALRLVEIILPSDLKDELRALLDKHASETQFSETQADGQINVRLLLEAEGSGAVVDLLSEEFDQVDGFRLLMLPVEAALPHEINPAQREPDDESVDQPAEKAQETAFAVGISRDELQEDIHDMTRLSRVFVAQVVLSTIVAAVGLLRDNVAVIIGAMVIAPLLGPNVALAFATTVGDIRLVRLSAMINSIGVSIALGLSILIGLATDIDVLSAQVATRTDVHLSDIVIALAAGSAGVLAMTTGVPAALVGVMVAVALLPPTVALGLCIGSAEWTAAAGAGMLLATNVICINLSGVLTFLVQGVQPRTWWEADRAKRSFRLAIIFWVLLLIALSVLIVLSQSESQS